MAIDVTYQGDELAPQQKTVLRSLIEVGFPSRGSVAVTVVYSKGAPPGKRYTARDGELRLVTTPCDAPGAQAPVTVDVTDRVQGLLQVAERNLVCHPVIPFLDD